MQKDSLKSVGALFDVPLGPLELSLVKRLGKGNFGSVYQCECRGSQVAVKMPLLKPGKGLKELKAAFVKEATILMRVSHRHVVQLLGVIDAPFQLDGNRSEFSIVTELLDCDVGFLFDINPKVCDSLVQRVTWAFQVVQGLAWIHGHGIVHRDLKIENLLYDRSSNIVKVSDVGLAVLADSFLPVAGSKLFLAPECFDLNPRAVTKQGDIYSLGLLFHCFLFRKRCPDALSVMKTFEQVCKWVLAGDRPNFLVEHPTVLVEMIRQCWDTDPQNRPTAVELLSRMRIVILDCAQIIERNKPFWLSDILVPKPVDLVKAVWKDFDETPSLEFFSAVHMEALKHLARMVDCQLESPQEIFRRIDDILLIGRKELFEPNQPPDFEALGRYFEGQTHLALPRALLEARFYTVFGSGRPRAAEWRDFKLCSLIEFYQNRTVSDVGTVLDMFQYYRDNESSEISEAVGLAVRLRLIGDVLEPGTVCALVRCEDGSLGATLVRPGLPAQGWAIVGHPNDLSSFDFEGDLANSAIVIWAGPAMLVSHKQSVRKGERIMRGNLTIGVALDDSEDERTHAFVWATSIEGHQMKF